MPSAFGRRTSSFHRRTAVCVTSTCISTRVFGVLQARQRRARRPGRYLPRRTAEANSSLVVASVQSFAKDTKGIEPHSSDVEPKRWRLNEHSLGSAGSTTCLASRAMQLPNPTLLQHADRSSRGLAQHAAPSQKPRGQQELQPEPIPPPLPLHLAMSAAN